MSNIHSIHPRKYRSIFISDVHLGFKGCQAEYLLDFLHSTQCEYLYLVGDIVDVWTMRRGVYWPQAHNNVLRSILGKAKHDTQVIFVPGNHDEVFREHAGMVFGNVAIEERAIHTTADGRRLLVIHGDEFDSVVRCSKWLAKLGSHAYDLLLSANQLFNGFRRRFGLGYWSLAAYLKRKVKNAVNYVSNFEEAIIHEGRKQAVDGLVCGHIHHAAISELDGLTYLNCGDWVESCTALVEHHDGRIELLHWVEERKSADNENSAASIPLASGE